MAYSDTESSIPFFSEIITFKDGTYQSDSYSGNPFHHEKESGKVEIKRDTLIFDESIKIIVLSINADSLVIKDENMTYTMKRLNDSLKNKSSDTIGFDGKSFIVDLGETTRTVSYKNGKVLFGHENVNESRTSFKRIENNGFDIFIQENALPKIIKGITNDTIILYSLHKKIHKIKMWEK